MAIVILEKGKKLSRNEFDKAREDFKGYIKVTLDIEMEIVALGGEYHADTERILLEKGSKQTDIWGGGVDLKTREFETNAMINLRAGRNDSTEIIDTNIRKKFLSLAKRALGKYVRKR